MDRKEYRREYNRKEYSRRIVVIAVVTAMIAVLVLSVPFASFGLSEGMKPIGDPKAEAPKIKAKAAAIWSVDLDRTVYEKNATEKMDPYSITKILTCWLALEILDPEEKVTVSEEATKEYENGTSIWLKPGEKIRVIDLVYGAMLASGNDAAYALGEAISGSESSFAGIMNQQAEEWGCTNTHFVNANGWKDADHYTTARDMSIIAKNCFANEKLLEVSDTLSYVIPATNMSGERKLKNFFRYTIGKVNDDKIPDAIDQDAKWMDEDDAEAVTGGKTGSWSGDDCSIVLEFSRDGLKGIIVLLGDTKKSRARDAAKLMDFAPVVTPGFMVSAKGDLVEKAWVRCGEKTRIELAVAKDTPVYPASGDPEDIRVETKVDKLKAPLSKGDKVGKYYVYIGDKLIAKRNLYVAEDVAVGWFPSYIYISNNTTIKIIEVIVGLIILLIIVRRINKRRSRKRREKRRRELERRRRMEEYKSRYRY